MQGKALYKLYQHNDPVSIFFKLPFTYMMFSKLIFKPVFILKVEINFLWAENQFDLFLFMQYLDQQWYHQGVHMVREIKFKSLNMPNMFCTTQATSAAWSLVFSIFLSNYVFLIAAFIPLILKLIMKIIKLDFIILVFVNHSSFFFTYFFFCILTSFF